MKISVIGLGLMGLPIAQRLMHCGHDVLGWNRSAERLAAAQAEGLNATADLNRVISQGEIVVLTLSDAAAIETVLFEQLEDGLLKGKQVIQMGTISPDESREIQHRILAAEAEYLEAPVLGSIPEAKNGSLIVMAAGPEAAYQHCLLLLRCLGKEVEHLGGVGQAAAMKLAMNQLIAALTAGFSLSLGLIKAEGVDVEQFMGLLRESALYAPTFDKKLGKMLEHNYANPNFPLKHLIKDLALYQEAADKNGIEPSISESMLAVLQQGCDAGYCEEDYASLYEAINPGFDMDVDEGC
ncbi:MAG: NAD(P)-dependent oxidoreductase [Gammaproteobacteria bacterium]|nr:NAD(P)-dependent oxidoreductase [Gammaproteobacteria bacterium]